ncbi:NAD(P)H-quinone oxidoreductase [Shewanella violacea]|uniref:Alcohol dehydrogenase, zinc-containing n=1 Tax=Shewanella violacea (strain JCM 10179 / CIP 106290 / LMG 19151 / DSS12) TaxID=637905 RepID=D4ZCE2_SHEVD|nr:NAD(P)H-quinone oxidoreductase [Shewanella violacea]BAJ03687.1 alcohol dehydrogenase, zinc-containing [Shewanella violacea DSS12]
MPNTSLAKNYLHVDFEHPGDADVMLLKRSPLPNLTKEQVLIKVAYAGVNGPDVAQRRGAYPPPKDASPILGLEVAGEICALGDGVTQWQLGDKVTALVPGGGYGEYVATYASHCLPIPQGWTLEQAAAIPETFFTVWGNLFMRAGLKPGETVLIHGGSGGIGSAAIALAKAFGARVIATSGSDDKCDYCLSLGADLALNYQDDFVKPVMEYTSNMGVQLVFDIAGGDFINQNLKALAVDGRMVSVAMQRGAQAQVDIFRIMAKRIIWTGSTLRPQSVEAKAKIAAELRQKVWPLLNMSQQDQANINKLVPNISARFTLADTIAAHRLMESGRHRGKIVLTVQEPETN